MNGFVTRDSSRADFWDERYAAGTTPWDAGGAPVEFRRLVASLRPGSRLLVPGCGLGWEIDLALERGLQVVAIDISRGAVNAARTRLGARAEGVVFQADFFTAALGEFDVIYERAFVCALPPRLWADWAARCAELLAPGGRIAGYFFVDPQVAAIPEPRRGPPFAAVAGEIEGLLAADFVLREQVAGAAPLDVFRGREFWFDWVRRGASSAQIEPTSTL